MINKSSLASLSLIGCSLLCLFSYGKSYEYGKEKPQPTPYHDWDFLMFSQSWPLTRCAEWKEAKSGNTCNLPKYKNLWTIHGIWPTKTGHLGPLFCPSAIHFDPEELQPMIDDLNTYWTNVEANTKPNSFWAHEWNKHGTCASTLPQLDSVPNYFRMGLKLNRKYGLSQILEKEGIVPSNTGYDINLIYKALKKNLNVEPSLFCVTDRKTKEPFISEIRICLNKSLELIDCDPSTPVHGYGVNTNCNLKNPVWYIPTVPTTTDSVDQMWIFSFLRTLIWLTL